VPIESVEDHRRKKHLTTYPPNFKHPKTHLVLGCVVCGGELQHAKTIDYGFLLIHEGCLKKLKEKQK
jgi:hypothetical protein